MSYISGARSVPDEQVRIASTKIYGIGPKKAIQVRYRLGISGNIKIKELTKYQIAQMEEMIGQDHVVHWELKRSIKRKISPRKNLYSYIQSQTTQKLSLFHANMLGILIPLFFYLFFLWLGIPIIAYCDNDGDDNPSSSFFEGVSGEFRNNGEPGPEINSQPSQGVGQRLPGSLEISSPSISWESLFQEPRGEQAHTSNVKAGPSAQDPVEYAVPSSRRRRVDSGPDSGSGPQYLNVSSDTEGRAAPEQRPPEQPPTLEEFGLLLEYHKKISDTIPKIFQNLRTRVPGGFQSEFLAEGLEERHGGQNLGGILRSLREEGRNSPFFREVQMDFQDLRAHGVTEATFRKEWQGRS